jgi:aminoglycoside phosphotransferase (APT) family kinase protein
MTLVQLTSPVTEWIYHSLGSQAKIISIEKLPGSTSSDLYKIKVKEGPSSFCLVLRLLTNAEWLADEPDLAEHEAGALILAHQTGLPVPEVVAWDADGLKCGIPAVLMTHVPGEVNLQSTDFDGWLRQMAEALKPIHAVDASSFKWNYYPYYDPKKLQVPSWTQNPRDWERAVEIVNQPAPNSQPVFIHRDYHPMNTLWQSQTLCGIVDWVNACRGPAAFDLAWNRLNLMSMYGVKAADQLRGHALTICSDEVWHPYWDLMALMELLPGPPEVYAPWPVFGLSGLSVPLLIKRTEEYLASILDKI